MIPGQYPNAGHYFEACKQYYCVTMCRCFSCVEMWERLLELRIHLQKMLSISNRLPPHDVHPLFVERGKQPTNEAVERGVCVLCVHVYVSCICVHVCIVCVCACAYVCLHV